MKASFRVTKITHGPRTDVEWTYHGRLKLNPVPLHWVPGARDAEDAANMTLSVLLPIAVAAGEDVDLPYPIAVSSRRFWQAKFAALQRFYKNPCITIIRPTEERDVPDYLGDKTGLCFGAGVDSMGTLCHHIKAGIPLHLFALRDAGVTGPVTKACMDAAAAAAGMPICYTETNANTLLGRYSRAVAKHMVWNDPFYAGFAPHQIPDEKEVVAYHFTRGFPFFFSALCALPPDVTRILYSYSCFPGMDCAECYGQGFAFYNDVPYRGARLIPFTAGSEIESAKVVFTEFPHIAQHMKSCPSEKVQWCGDCRKCVRIHLFQRVLGLPALPVPQVSILARRMPLGQATDMLSYYRRHLRGTDEALETVLLKLVDASAALFGGLCSSK